MPSSGSYYYPQMSAPNSSYPTVDLRKVSAPSSAANLGRIYVDTNGDLHFLDPNGNDILVVQGGSSGVNSYSTDLDSFTVDWSSGSSQELDLTTSTSSSIALSMSNGHAGGTYLLKLVLSQSITVNYDSDVFWQNGTAPTNSTGSDARDIVSFWFDGTNYFGNAGPNYF